MKLEIGCGSTPRKTGYQTCDIRCLSNINFCCNAIDLDKHIEENTVTHIYARHFMEHLTFYEADLFLNVLYKILKPQGEIEIIVPNMTFHINQWINKRNDKKQFQHAKAGFWGWQRGKDENYWDVHKSGYDKETIQELISKHKFINFKSRNSEDNPHLHVFFYKE